MRPIVERLLTSIVPRRLLRPVLQRRFLATHEWTHQHWSVFDSFAGASQWASQHAQTPHYHPGHRQWQQERSTLLPHDYPMVFWLAQILGQGPARVADLGGSVGVSYLTFRRVLPFAKGLQWQVCKLPETVTLGRPIAQEQGATHLTFTEDIHSFDGADVLFTAGAIQFIETPLPDLLHAMRAPSKHVLINRLPLTGRPATFVTLQHSGHAFWPCRVANEHAFVQAMTAAGYHQIDKWRCIENLITIPLRPDRTIPWFHGLYFKYEAAL